MTLLDTHVWLRWLPGAEQALPDTVLLHANYPLEI